MKRQYPNTVEKLENSPWGEMVKDPKSLDKVIRDAGKLIDRLGKNSPVAARAREALDLFSKSRMGEMLTARNVLILAAALAYFVLPVDAIPDFVPVVGWLDDLGILAMAVNFILPKKAEQEGEVVDVPTNEEVINNFNIALSDNWSDSNMQEDLDRMEGEIETLGDNELMNNLTELRSTMSDPLRRVIFAGGFNAGKSSLINSLLGMPLLPERPIPCTRALTTIMYGTEPRVSVEKKDGSITETADLSVLKDDAAMAEAKEVVVFLPNDLLRNGLSLVDTCGLEHSGFDEREFSELPGASVLVFVKSLNVGGVNETEGRFCADAAAALTSDHIIVVLNMTDLVNKQELATEETEIRKFFVDRGMLNIQTVSTCSLPERTDAGVAALRAELIQRAASSMQSDYQSMVQEQINALNHRITQSKAAQAEMARLSAETLAKAKARAAKHVEKRINHLEQLALKADRRFESSLHIFISESLLPRVTELAKRLPLNEQYAASVVSLLRDSLATYVKKEVSDIAAYFQTEWKVYSDSDVREFTANLAADIPQLDEAKLDKIGGFLLPGASIAAFIAMPLFGWLTTVALPLFVLDKLSVGEKLVGLYKTLGPSAKIRSEFIETIKAQMEVVERNLCDRIHTEVISAIVDRQINELRSTLA